MNKGKVLIGIILVILAAIFFIFMPIINPLGGYSGGTVFAILGLISIAKGRKE